ncbi:MAG: glycosyltransferase family 2 protein [Planctomycetota bacterium]|jgi:glycosyltransferase involved in cell wall biosynthesis
MDFSIVVPTFNEEEAIVKEIEIIKDVLKDYKHSYEIIVVDDGSIDRTFELASSQSVEVIRHSHNRGYGAALKTGIKRAKYDWIVITDADGTYPFEAVLSFLEFTPQFDMVVGARTGSKVKIPLIRKPAKWFLTKIAGFLSGQKIPDLNSGLRIFRKDLCMEFFHLCPQGFSFTSTITMAFLTNNYTVKYVPIDYHERVGKSSIRAYDFVNFNKLLFRMTLFFNPLKLFSLISGGLFVLAMCVFLYSKLFLEKAMDISTIVILMSSLQVFLFGLLAELIIELRDKK